MIRVFIGYDSAETVAYNVLSHSIHRNASEPVAITPIMLSQLQSVYHRSQHNLASTEFSFSRFLTPYLCDYGGRLPGDGPITHRPELGVPIPSLQRLAIKQRYKTRFMMVTEDTCADGEKQHDANGWK